MAFAAVSCAGAPTSAPDESGWMRDRSDWHEIRSNHAKVLEALEAAISAHPSGSQRRRNGRPGDLAARRRTKLALVRDSAPAEAVVVPFRPRVVTLVAHGPSDDEPTAA